jgi:eukaryotic-like serine/threonine-protein kinase
MEPGRWKQIDKLFIEALEYDASGRDAFLDQACAGDKALRCEVESLLACQAEAKSFIEAPALKVAAQLFADEQADSAPKQRIGPYKLGVKLGAGGMGEVYLAQDTRLGRKVALKLLPTEYTSERDRVLRFQQEARAASALNHPNIITIYEIGQVEDVHFIATEFIDGETLRQRMEQANVELIEAVDIALQVAQALEAAHNAGIAHRDIKPENIMLRRDGYVKVLDFGLAKLTELQPFTIDTQEPTGGMVRTMPGTVIGTVAYMSPEQARGLEVDARTDIWSLGVLIYEMIAQQRPFTGGTIADALAAILHLNAPPLEPSAPEAPAALERIVAKALRKEREERYQTAKELGAELKDLKLWLELQAALTKPEAFSGGGKPTTLDTAPATATMRTGEDATAHVTSTTEILIGEVKRHKRGVVITLTAMLLAAAFFYYWRSANLKWAKDQVSRVEELAQEERFFEAYDLALLVKKYLPEEATVARLMRAMADDLTVSTDPPGAQVYLKRFAPDESRNFPLRQLVGATPINHLQIARGAYVLYLEKEGYAKLERAISGSPLRPGLTLPPSIHIAEKLIETAEVPDRMAHVPGGEYRLTSWRRPTEERVRLDTYFIDKFEVTNREYKEFIDAGGYLKRQFWKYPFVNGGNPLAWEEAIQHFKDRTGLSGPRNWSSQDFPEDQAEHPITGVTWYEAAAYAAFRGKQLPTIFQWEKAARGGRVVMPAAQLMPWGFLGETVDHRANFKGQGSMPVASLEFGISPYGCYHMAGNVSEWCLNESSAGFITSGGSWADPPYLFGGYGSFPGFYSSDKLGFRCALNSPGAKSSQGDGPIKAEVREPVYIPASGAKVREWLNYYRFEQTPLKPQIIEAKETAEWRREKISYAGAEGERAIAYLYLPKNFPRPLQVIHFMPPGSVGNRTEWLPQSVEIHMTPFIKSGRAVLTVMIKGYLGRDWPANYMEPDRGKVEYRDQVVNWITDLRRALDYLETRSDIDMSRLAYHGASADGIKLILPAVENRYHALVLWGANVEKSDVGIIPEANPINFAPHIRGPKLMIHGRYDEANPLKFDAKPLYKLLREPKHLETYEGGHRPPLEILVPMMNSWLDEKLGPVKRE